MSDNDAELSTERTAALAQSEESFRLLVEQAPDAIIVLDLDTNRIVEANPSAEKLFGYARDELPKHDLREFAAPSQPDGLPVAQSFQAHIARAAAGEALAFEHVMRNAQGQEFSCEVRLNRLPWMGRNLLRVSFVDISERATAEKHLAEMESKYRGLLEAAPDAMVVVNTGGDIVLLNVQAEKQFGYRRDELLGQKVKNVILVGFAERLVADSLRSVAEVLAQQIGMGIELTARRKDGSEFPIELMLSPLESTEGVLVTAAIRDISKRKAAEKHLAQMESKYRGLLEAAPDAMVVVNTDGDIVLLNVQAERQFGYRRDELLGQKVKRIIPDGFAERLVADSLRSVAEVLAQQIGMGIELTARRKDGSEFLIELMLSPLESTEGVLVTAAIRDISKRKAAEESLRLSERRYRTLVTAAPQVVWSTDAQGKIIEDIPSWRAFTAQAFEEMKGDGWLNAVHPDDRERVAKTWSSSVKAGTFYNVEYRVRRPDGGYRHAAARAAVVAEGGVTSEWIGTLTDISEHKRSERALQTLSRGNEALVRAADEDQLLKEMCEVIVETGGYVMAWIGFAEHDEAKTLRPVAWAGHETGYLDAAQISWADTERGQGPTGTAIRTGKPQVNRNFATSPQLAPWRAEALERGYVSSLALPLKADTRIIGALTIYAAEPDAFDGDEPRLLAELADDLSYGIAALRARADGVAATQALRNSMEATIAALASTVELRDPYTAGHQYNVSRLAAAIARDMGLSEHDIEGIRLAGVVHDVGKISVPSEILSKPGKLNKVEFELIKMHAQAGHDIVKGVVFPWPVAQMILQHHERLDGSGYPNGFKKDEILIGAKILAVADVVEAMMARRPYREALGLDAALAEIEAGKGTRYDPAAVDACRALFRESRFSFPS